MQLLALYTTRDKEWNGLTDTTLAGLVLHSAYSASLVSFLSAALVPVKCFPDLLVYGFANVSNGQYPTTNITISAMKRHGLLPTVGNQNHPAVRLDEAIPVLFTSRLAIMSFSYNLLT